MAELFIQIAVSLDNYIEDASRDLEWFTNDTSLDALATETLQSIDGMIFGRKAHSLLAQFWPTAGDDAEASADLKEQARLMNALPKYVLTHGRDETGWANSHLIRADDIPALKARVARPIALFAGARAVQTALERGLAEELRIIRYPILLGGGTPLFRDGAGRLAFTLLGTDDFPSGATVERYRVGKQ